VTRLTDLPPDQAKRLAALEYSDFETRPWVIGPALSIPPAVAFGVLARGGTPTDHAGTTLAAGLSSAAWGAFVFAFGCPSDAPLYIAVWYTVDSSIVTIVGRAVLPRLPRWSGKTTGQAALMPVSRVNASRENRNTCRRDIIGAYGASPASVAGQDHALGQRRGHVDHDYVGLGHLR